MKISYKHEIKADDQINDQEILNLILKDRSIKNIDQFINPPLPQTLKLTDFSRGFAKEIKKTLSILEKIKENNQMIVIYTDYDADGISGGTILWETLHLLGFKTMPYVPHRKLEGYGFSIKGINNIKKQYSPSLIISVDHGITAKEKVTYAKSIGIPIIITDHHLKPKSLPTDALAIFHIPELSGSGVAYVFAKMIFDHFQSTANKQLLENYFAVDYPCLAAIGTIADLVPLVGASRSIVKHGLQAVRNTRRVGIKAILQEAGIDNKPITPYEVGFIIAPRINAIGRLSHAIDALRLLCTKDHKKAHRLAKFLGNTNQERQDLVEKSVEEAKKQIEKEISTNKNRVQKLIILISEKWHEGIIGLIASKIAEIYYRPTIVITKTDNFYKGSARSFPNFHMTNFLRDLKENLVDVGGHAGAAGFTIEKTKLNKFVEEALKSAQEKIKNSDLERIITADIKIPISKLNLKLAKLIEQLQPFGIGNPQPSFVSDCQLIDTKIIGKTNKHMKLLCKDPKYVKSTNLIEFISFNSSSIFPNLFKNQWINIVYRVQINHWNGNQKINGIVEKIIID